MNKVRLAIAFLTLSAPAFVTILTSESYTDKAIIPTKNDRPTVGHGLTWRPDGSPVMMGDTITPNESITRSYAHIAKSESHIKQCVTAPLSQTEYDVLIDFSYQYGESATCKSSIVSNINSGNYEASCNAYLKYKYSGGYDCSTLINGKPNKRCWGVWTRNLERKEKCLQAQ